MSHFTVAVITDKQPTYDEIAAILQPWHEYECTGIDDEYVIDVDVTDDLIADHAKYGKDKPFDEFAEGRSSATKREDGRYYRRTNPNRKWDWWQIGGRWSGLLKLKPGIEAVLGTQSWCGGPAEPGHGDSARIRDIDLSGIAEDGRTLCTFAAVKDGQWFERGKMGWWACVSDEKPEGQWEAEFAKLLDDNPDSFITIVDCHI